MSEKKWPEVHDLVSVTIKQVDYYGYIDHIDFDLRAPTVRVEFYPGHIENFDLDEITLVEFPEKKK